MLGLNIKIITFYSKDLRNFSYGHKGSYLEASFERNIDSSIIGLGENHFCRKTFLVREFRKEKLELDFGFSVSWRHWSIVIMGSKCKKRYSESYRSRLGKNCSAGCNLVPIRGRYDGFAGYSSQPREIVRWCNRCSIDRGNVIQRHSDVEKTKWSEH